MLGRSPTSAPAVLSLTTRFAPFAPGTMPRFASPAAGYYTVANQLSGMVLDVRNKSTADGAQIIQYPSNGGTNQQWSLIRK